VLIWFGPNYLPKSSQQPGNPTLKILTFNVWGYNEHLEDVDAWLLELDPDVVLLQEISSGLADGREQLINRRFPYRASQNSAVREFGSLILSRYPILSEESLPDQGNQSQNRVTIDANGRIITIYNVHMPQPLGQSRLPLPHESFFARTILSYDNTVRDEQIRLLLQRIDGEENPVIVAGDFNMSDQTIVYQDMSAVLNDAFREAATGSGRSWPVRILDEISPLIPPLLRVDYIWHSRHFRTVDAFLGPKLGSDHLPLFAELE
ncbi:MAG: hypothetical protein GWN00_23690, partial [Aliifodinibius sp.]|nr:hypothetical protein [Fodinibius sp.]NIV13930.1 hypothetical protein [Fodinibius sp.]NIY27697.1 hypothetical protein [Fodinibius sp.]